MIHCICGIEKPESEMVSLWGLILVCQSCADKHIRESEWNAFRTLRVVVENRETKLGG